MDKKFISYYNNKLHTKKFEAYSKNQISLQIFTVLKDLRLIKLSHLDDSNILIIKNPINKFLISYMKEKHGAKYRIKWFSAKGQGFFLFLYYGWLFMEFIRRGVVFHKDRKKYKLSMEAVWGFRHRTLRNDILIDNKRFSSKDILILPCH